MKKSMFGDILDDYLTDIADQMDKLFNSYKNKEISKEKYDEEMKLLYMQRDKVFEEKENQVFSFRIFKEKEFDIERELNGIDRVLKQELTPEQKVLRKQLDFRRLAEKRMQKVIKSLRSIKNLFNKSHYNYENNWIQEMQVALQTELNALFDIPGYKIVAQQQDRKGPDFMIEFERFKTEMMKKNEELADKLRHLKEIKEFEIKYYKEKINRALKKKK